MAAKRPNLLLITTDEQRYDFLGALNKMPVRTPVLDQLVQEGAYHPHSYTVSPVCMPARCSILTGLYPHQHGCMNNQGDLNPSLSTLPSALQSLGYQTSLVGKEHFFEGFVDLVEAKPHSKRTFGWDYMWTVAGKSMVAGLTNYPEASEDHWTQYLAEQGLLQTYRESTSRRMDMRSRGECEAGPSVLDEEHHVDYRVKEESISYLQKRDHSKPFFLWTSFCSPHFPFDPPKHFLDHYSPGNMPVPISCPPDQVEHYQKYLASYCAMVEQIDTYIGSILAELRKQGEIDNTLIVFLSDHGDMMGDFGLFAKNFPHEGSTRVPLIARHPDIASPGSYPEAVEITDVVATFLEVAGAERLHDHLPESPSKSLLSVWRGDGLTRRFAFSENGYQFEAPFEMLVDKHWKYVFYSFTGEELLFDLEHDPNELTDLAPKEPAKIAEFRKILLRRTASTTPPTPGQWIYQRIHNTDAPNPRRCHHGGLPEYENRGIDSME